MPTGAGAPFTPADAAAVNATDAGWPAGTPAPAGWQVNGNQILPIQTPNGPAVDANGWPTQAGVASGYFPKGTTAGPSNAFNNTPGTPGAVTNTGVTPVPATPGQTIGSNIAGAAPNVAAPTPKNGFTPLGPGGVAGGIGIFGAGPSVGTPDNVAFTQQGQNAALLASQFGKDAASALGAAAPKIQGLGSFDKSMSGLAGTYGQIASGQGPAGHLAENQYKQALGQDIDSQTAMARSATGGAIGQAGAERAALQNSAGLAAGQAGNSAIQQGQMQLGALSAEQQAYQAALAANTSQAGLTEQQHGINDSLASSLYGLQNNSSQSELAALTAFTNATNQASGLQLTSDQLAAGAGNSLLNAGVGAGGGLLQMLSQGGGGGGGSPSTPSYTPPSTDTTASPTSGSGTTGPTPGSGDTSGGLAVPPPDAVDAQQRGRTGLNGTGSFTSDEDAKLPANTSYDSNGLPPLSLSPTPAQQVETSAISGLGQSDSPAVMPKPQQPNSNPLASIIGMVPYVGSAYNALVSSTTSDANAKRSMAAPPSMVDDFLRRLDPKAYRYKSTADEPSPNPHGGEYLGVMAQDLERTPKIGDQLVSQQPGQYKQVNTAPMVSALAAGVGRLNERLSALEGSRGNRG